MNTDTPETDAVVFSPHVYWPDFARRLELERDEARGQVENQKARIGEFFAALEKLTSERDEAREALKHITEYGTGEINAAVELRQKLAQALVDLDNMQDQRDLAMKVIKRLEQERDEARSAIAALNQRLVERQESFQAQLIRIEDVWREKLTESRKDAARLYNCLLEVGVYELDEHYYVSNVLAQHEELVRNG